jgi:hypothetical protein
MFDDPNLRAVKYGWIHYRELAEHARRHRYHVAIAMVPQDARFSSRDAVDIFSCNSEQLSLLFHGNDHTRAELTAFDERRLTAACAQALRRVLRFENASQLTVDRVMVPPHGGCGMTALTVLPRLGFDAVCVSPGSLVHWNSTLGESYPHVGLGVTELSPEAFPVVPRFGFGPDASLTASLSAFLHQPIICRGHHHDCAGGLDPLAELADHINQLGEVSWGSLAAILRQNYLHRQDGGDLYVKPLARKMTVAVPPGTTDVFIDWPVKSAVTSVLETGGCATELPVELRYGAEMNLATVADPEFRPWPYLRRALCETRDRLGPVLGRPRARRLLP